MTNEGKNPLERLAEIEEEKDAIFASLRIRRTELRKELEEIEGKLGPAPRVKRVRKPKVEGEVAKPRKKRGGLGSVVPADVIA